MVVSLFLAVDTAKDFDNHLAAAKAPLPARAPVSRAWTQRLYGAAKTLRSSARARDGDL